MAAMAIEVEVRRRDVRRRFAAGEEEAVQRFPTRDNASAKRLGVAEDAPAFAIWLVYFETKPGNTDR